MKHFVKKHTHHFGLWALSGLLLIWSMMWLNNLDKQTAQNTLIKTAEIKSATSSAETMSPKILRYAQDDNKKQNDTKNNQPISASILANDVISGVTPTENQKDTIHSTENDQNEQKIPVTFKIISPTASKEFVLQVKPQSTVYDAMNELSKQIPIKFKQFSAGLGAFVEEIDGWANDSKTNLFWIYYINGQTAKLGVSSIKLNPNDIISWRYEQGKF